MKKYKLWLLLAWLILLLASLLVPRVNASAPTEVIEIPQVLERIAMCESRNNENAKNPNSSASGRYQWIKSSWKFYGNQLWGEQLAEKNVFDYWDNTELAIYVYQKYGTSPWDASKPCWSK